jgi:hypothetical protein
MRVARQAPAAVTGRLGGTLKAQGQEKGEGTFDKRLAVAQQLHVGRFVVKIDGDGPVLPCPFTRSPHVAPML